MPVKRMENGLSGYPKINKRQGCGNMPLINNEL